MDFSSLGNGLAMDAQMNSIQNQLASVLNSYNQLERARKGIDSPQPSIDQSPRSPEVVNGIEGAKNYLKNMPRNSSATPFDANESIFYALSVDANGVPGPIKIGRFTIEDYVEEKPDFITRKDLEELETRIINAFSKNQNQVSFPQNQRNGQDRSQNVNHQNNNGRNG